MRVVCVVLLLCLHTVLSYVKEKPHFVRTCYKSDPEFDKCSTEGIQSLVKHIKNGFPELEVEPLDPIFLKEIKILQGRNNPVSINASFHNATITGVSGVNISSATFNWKKNIFKLVTYVPKIRAEGDYKLNGRILLIPLSGQGHGWIEPEGIHLTADLFVKLIEKEGRKFYELQKIDADYTVQRLRLKLGGLYNGQKTLEESTNKYLNENWRAVNESIKPLLTKTITDIIFKILKNVLLNIPAEFMLGDL